jgi:stage II sporulation protein D
VILKKRKRIWIMAGLFLCIFLILAAVLFTKKKSTDIFTMAEASKMLAYAATDFKTSGTDDTGKYWYSGYVNAVSEAGLLKIKKPEAKVRFKDTYALAKKLEVPETVLAELQNSAKAMTKQEFLDVFMQLLPYMQNGEQVVKMQAGIAGTPATLKQAGEWEVYTTKGTYRFTGIVLDDKIDKTVTIYTCGKEILAVEDTVENLVEYKNIWIKSSTDTTVETNVYGADRIFKIPGLTAPVENVLADLKVENGSVTQINTKTDTITGMVQAVTKDYVEVQGYGKVALDDAFMIYDIYNGFAVKTYQDIIVGYSLQDFIVAEGKICGAVISKPLNVQNIRIILKNSGFKSIFHENVRLTCSKSFMVSTNEQQTRYNAGDVFELTPDNELLLQGRVTVTPDNGGEISILSVMRSQGVPSYEGSIELAAADDGIVIVNDVPVESYLKRVVPSEMPASFAVEALKVQAVCARSYAYKHLENGAYSEYGAHVDDSTMYQVYNNTSEQSSSNEAIQNTRGQILTYNGEVVQTYYYSTSCGVTTDVGIWGSDSSSYPYFVSRFVSRSQKELDLTDEAAFEAFITSKDENDYDAGYALYRWELQADITALSNSFNAKLYEKYLSAPSKILTQQADGSFQSQKITDIGTITSVTVNERAAGGAVKSVTVCGSAATVRIDSESCIRGLFGMTDAEMTTNTGTTKMASLPSTFCIFKPVYEKGSLSGYRIIGGGYGHGIGMSQNAVNEMVKDAMNYQQILQFFYPGTAIEQK